MESNNNVNLLIKLSDVFSKKDLDFNIIKDIIQNDDVNWSWILNKAKTHRTLPAIAYKVFSMELDNYIKDKDIILKLKNSLNQTQIRNERYTNEISNLCLNLNKVNIDYLLIKGEVLSLNFYPFKGIREFGDCDMLLINNNIGRCEKVLIENGYIQGYGEDGNIINPTKKEVLFSKLFMKHIIAYVKYDENLLYVIEPHYNIFWRVKGGNPAFSLSMNELIENSNSIYFNGVKTKTMNNEDFLMYLCIDIYEDANRIEKIMQSKDLELIKFLDIYSIIHDGINWDKFIKNINAWEMQKPVYYTLYFLNLLYQIVPNHVIESFKVNDISYLNEFGFDEELIGLKRGIYKRPFTNRLFDEKYRISEIHNQKEYFKPTTFQNLKEGLIYAKR